MWICEDPGIPNPGPFVSPSSHHSTATATASLRDRFPPVTISAAKQPFWQTPLYKTLGEAALTAKPWPLIEGWDEFNNIIIANVGGYPVRLRDVGSATIGAISERSVSRYNGKPSLNIGVIKQAVANPLLDVTIDGATQPGFAGAPLVELSGLTMGIVGFGRIGQAEKVGQRLARRVGAAVSSAEGVVGAANLSVASGQHDRHVDQRRLRQRRAVAHRQR